MFDDDTGRMTVEPVELEMGVWGLCVHLRRDGIDYSMNLHETRSGRHSAEMARMFQERLDLAVRFAVEDAIAVHEQPA